MASVRKRKWTSGGVENVAWVVAYTDQAGKRRLKTFDYKRDADAYRQQVESEIEKGIHTPTNESVTVAEAAEAFFRSCEKRVRLGDITKGTMYQYRSVFASTIVPYFGARRVSEITGPAVQDFVDGLRGSFSAHTVNSHYVALKVFLTFCVRSRWVKRNVLRDEPCKLPQRPKRTAIPSRADIVTLIDALQKPRAQIDAKTHINRAVAVMLGIFGGLRPGEVFGLQWENVDFEKGIVRVRNTLSKTDGLKGPKTKAGNRDVPMTPPIRRALYEAARYATIMQVASSPGYASYSSIAVTKRIWSYWKRQSVEPNFEQLKGYVCIGRGGAAKSVHTNKLFWFQMMQDAGLWDETKGRAQFTQHALRHAAASLFIAAGLPPMNLKTIMGHASVTTTYDIYGHLFPEDQRTIEAANSIAASLDATTTRQIALSA